MKCLTITLCTVLLALAASTTKAQSAKFSKPSLFKNYPETAELSEAQLNKLFAGKKGEQTLLTLSGGLLLNGPMVSNISKYSNLQSIAIKLPAFNNILFALSKRIAKDNSIIYTGHLFSRDYADGYELQKVGNKYQLIKVDMEKLLPACNQ
jgi:hypothetical protein